MALNAIQTAEDLAAWMRRMNLSLSAAAEQLGRKRATISRYINGITELPESVAHHAAVIEAARNGAPFEKRTGGRPAACIRTRQADASVLAWIGKMPGDMQGAMLGQTR